MNAYRAEHQAELTALAEQCQRTERRHANAQRRFRVMSGLALVAVTGVLFLSPANRAALAQGTGLTLQSLQAEIVTLQHQTQFIQIDSNNDMHSRHRGQHQRESPEGISDFRVGAISEN